MDGSVLSVIADLSTTRLSFVDWIARSSIFRWQFLKNLMEKSVFLSKGRSRINDLFVSQMWW